MRGALILHSAAESRTCCIFLGNAANLCAGSRNDREGQGLMKRMSPQTMPLRKAYVAPRLKLYGTVQTLTAGGTGMINEGTQNPGVCMMGSNTANQFAKHCQ